MEPRPEHLGPVRMASARPDGVGDARFLPPASGVALLPTVFLSLASPSVFDFCGLSRIKVRSAASRSCFVVSCGGETN